MLNISYLNLIVTADASEDSLNIAAIVVAVIARIIISGLIAIIFFQLEKKCEVLKRDRSSNAKMPKVSLLVRNKPVINCKFIIKLKSRDERTNFSLKKG